ncbi:N-acetyltransferase [Luteimonas sp. SJ-92]|uniref:N-acetyltransferase n=1 Tax=Luteimonas salinisoli TaxID=2752307 RepID=A0A853JFG7_9GAMM|nr:N-acetyltransferase [Luteimonas salinisoli]
MSEVAGSVRHDPGAGRFWVDVDGHRGTLEYRRSGGTMAIVQTVVPPAVGGRGIARRLVEAAVRHARIEGLAVDPICSYAQAWLRRHPERAGAGGPARDGAASGR